MDHDEYVSELLGSTDFNETDILKSMMPESEELALIAFHEFRKQIDLFIKTTCPGHTDSFCCMKKKEYEELCEDCQTEVDKNG